MEMNNNNENNNTVLIERLNRRIDNLKKKNLSLEKEMVERGKEITKMIRIFLMFEHLIPEDQRKEFRSVAVGYALRQDKDRGTTYCRGVIDFQESKVKM